MMMMMTMMTLERQHRQELEEERCIMCLNVRVKEVKEHEVPLLKKEAIKLALKVIDKYLGFKPHYFIEDDKVKEEVEYYTSHRFELVEDVRTVNHLDEHTYAVVKALKEILYES